MPIDNALTLYSDILRFLHLRPFTNFTYMDPYCIDGGVGFVEAKVGVKKPELLPKDFTTVIDVAVTEAIEVVKMAKDAEWGVVISQGSGKTDDCFIADLVVDLPTADTSCAPGSITSLPTYASPPTRNRSQPCK
ncbi:hypothetical protein L2E82_35431 [Cichorium intybus]|uniref:Uncharacterized protein n=1 Tax=Cichorium intybus TaxID=13427 RepID=A0ACB9BNT8_CICIN|nr:hypothetical protein L2E82_35431 [Cichorium intybus]